MKVCHKTCIFFFFPIINKYLCMAKRSLLSRCPSYFALTVNYTAHYVLSLILLRNLYWLVPEIHAVIYTAASYRTSFESIKIWFLYVALFINYLPYCTGFHYSSFASRRRTWREEEVAVVVWVKQRWTAHKALWMLHKWDERTALRLPLADFVS